MGARGLAEINDNDCNGVTDDDVDDDGNGATDDDVDYDNQDGATDDKVDDNDGNGATDDNIGDDCYGATDNEVDNDGDGTTGGRHRLDACGGCALKDDGWWRHATTGNATTSGRTRGKQEERCQQTRVDGALIGRGCALRGRGIVERTRGGGIDKTTSWRTRDGRGGGKSNGDGDGDGKCR